MLKYGIEETEMKTYIQQATSNRPKKFQQAALQFGATRTTVKDENCAADY